MDGSQTTIPAKEGGKLHGNDGNQHAKKDVTKSVYLQVRCTPQEKERIRKNAQKAGLSISDYVLSLAK